MARHKVKWDNKFTLYGTGTNLACGVVALFFWLALIISSLPYFRRKMFETFYFLHLNFFFLANLMTIFHARAQVVPWVAAAFLIFYIDFSIRVISKMSNVTPKHIEIIGDNIVKLVLSVDKFPRAAFVYGPGSYIWLSISLKKTVPGPAPKSCNKGMYVKVGPAPDSQGQGLEMVAVGENADNAAVVVSTVDDTNNTTAVGTDEIFANIKLPGGPPSGVPSWLWFHPITVASYNSKSNEITLYIKSFGEGVSQWSGQLLAAARLVNLGVISLDDISFHVGGPNGELMIKDPLESLNRVIMVSGGIGITPFLPILEDLIDKKYSGIVEFVWSTRSVAEVNAFKHLFERCADLPNFHIHVHFTSKKQTGASDAEEGVQMKPVSSPGYTVIEGRPDYQSIQVAAGETTAALVCGPEEMIIAVEHFVYDRQRQGLPVLFHREVFDF